jgi:hypothetical protein
MAFKQVVYAEAGLSSIYVYRVNGWKVGLAGNGHLSRKVALVDFGAVVIGAGPCCSHDVCKKERMMDEQQYSSW